MRISVAIWEEAVKIKPAPDLAALKPELKTG